MPQLLFLKTVSSFSSISQQLCEVVIVILPILNNFIFTHTLIASSSSLNSKAIKGYNSTWFLILYIFIMMIDICWLIISFDLHDKGHGDRSTGKYLNIAKITIMNIGIIEQILIYIFRCWFEGLIITHTKL